MRSWIRSTATRSRICCCDLRISASSRLRNGVKPSGAHDEAIDEQQDDGADDAANEACGLAGIVPADGLPKVSRDECADDPQNGRQDEALRLGLVAGHDEFGNHSNDEADNDGPKDAHRMLL